MVGQKVNPTRSELLSIKKKIKLAKKGHGLLKKKQDYLINEFFTLVKEYKEYKQSIQNEVKETYNALSLDIAYTGAAVTRSVSYATNDCFTIEFFKKNMMGVQLPQIKAEEKAIKENTFENSPLLAEATRNFRSLFQKMIKLSSMKLAIHKIADEIKKLKRRVNSLEHIQIPKLEGLRDYIVFVLGEQERESFTRLKLVKQNL